MAYYLCYIIGNGSRTYCGMTNNFPRRLRQHNKELSGGARFTTVYFDPRRPWHPLATVRGIRTKSEAMSFERATKRYRRSHARTPAHIVFESVLQDPRYRSRGWRVHVMA